MANPGYNGVVSFIYQVCDPGPLCDPATVTITIDPVNEPPVGADDNFTVNEDAVLTASVTGNDSDPETPNSGLSWGLTSGGTAAANGVLTFNANGTFSYAPTAQFNGPVSFTYDVCDPQGACDPANVSIEVLPVNDPPVAGDDGFTMNEGTVLADVLGGGDSDLETANADLIWSLVNGGTAALHGVIVINADGTFAYTPNANYNGGVSFTYQVCDAGGLCDPATVTITIDPVNGPPIALNDNFSMAEDGALYSSVAGNDSDLDNTNAQLTWSLVDGATAAANGALILNADGTFSYVPDPGFSSLVSFTYEVCDQGPLCVQAVATIDVGSLNDAPVANNDAAAVDEDNTLNATVIANDSDADGDVLTYGLVSGGTAAVNGSLTLLPNGSYTYTPNANFNGLVQFTYQACDPSNVCDAATVSITVNSVNDPPVAGDDGYTMDEDGALAGTVTNNDSDVEGLLTWTLVNPGTAGANGALSLNSDGTFTYSPNANFNGSVSFTYQVCDVSAVCDVAIVTITIAPVNDPPVADDDTFSVNEEATLSASVIGNDSDVESALTWTLTSGGSADANGALVFNADGTFLFTPNADLNGPVSFGYQACDAEGLCDVATVTITVVPVNDPPVAEDDVFSMNEDGSLGTAVAGNDSDTETTSTGLLWSLVSGGSAAVNGTLTFNPDGDFTFAPNSNFNGQVSFTYSVCDPANACDPALVVIDVLPVNDPPVASNDNYDMLEDASLNASVAGNDADVDNIQSELVYSLISGGTADANGTLVFNADGSFTYTPAQDVTGDVSFTYTVCDPGALCSPATVTITINAVNDPPIAGDNAYTMSEDGTLSDAVGANDSDAETPECCVGLEPGERWFRCIERGVDLQRRWHIHLRSERERERERGVHLRGLRRWWFLRSGYRHHRCCSRERPPGRAQRVHSHAGGCDPEQCGQWQ